MRHDEPTRTVDNRNWIHKAGHASGAKPRLDRDLSGRFGSASYALEEISVEILSGRILVDLGIAHHPRPDHLELFQGEVELVGLGYAALGDPLRCGGSSCRFPGLPGLEIGGVFEPTAAR